MIQTKFEALAPTRTNGAGARAVSTLPVVPAAAGLALVEAALGYEWLLSGLNKVLGPGFAGGLARQLHDGLQGNPNTWYVSMMENLVLPNAGLFARLVTAGEVLVALGLFAGAMLWAGGRRLGGRLASLLNGAAIGALFGAVLMSANYALMSGDTLPGLNPGNPFNEGLSIDSLLTIIGLGLLAIHVLAQRFHDSGKAAL